MNIGTDGDKDAERRRDEQRQGVGNRWRNECGEGLVEGWRW